MFWKAFLTSLGADAAAVRVRALGDWQGLEDGQPLAWHFQHIEQVGFSALDRFWRCECDAIYGGVLR